jgi:hypothetical protein
MVLGLRTVIYHVKDLDKAKGWYVNAFGVNPRATGQERRFYEKGQLS